MGCLPHVSVGCIRYVLPAVSSVWVPELMDQCGFQWSQSLSRSKMAFNKNIHMPFNQSSPFGYPIYTQKKHEIWVPHLISQAQVSIRIPLGYMIRTVPLRSATQRLQQTHKVWSLREAMLVPVTTWNTIVVKCLEPTSKEFENKKAKTNAKKSKPLFEKSKNKGKKNKRLFW